MLTEIIIIIIIIIIKFVKVFSTVNMEVLHWTLRIYCLPSAVL